MSKEKIVGTCRLGLMILSSKQGRIQWGGGGGGGGSWGSEGKKNVAHMRANMPPFRT